jgi:hypothetical protein
MELNTKLEKGYARPGREIVICIQIWGLLLLLFSSFRRTKNLQNHIFLILCFVGKRKRYF